MPVRGYRKRNPLHSCDNCGVEFVLTKSQRNSPSKTHYCSRDCYAKNCFIDLTGKQFDRWYVIEFFGIFSNGSSKWLCECECGTKKPVFGFSLTKGESRSCGCLQKEVATENWTIHGHHKTRLYSIYMGMKSRCNYDNSSSYDRYRGRGISICEEWNNDFITFYDWANKNGYEEHLTLDRIDNDGNYEPSNCRWATVKEQNNNMSSNIVVTHNGKSQNITQWANELGIHPYTFGARLRKNLDEDKLFARKREIKNKGIHAKQDKLSGVWYSMKSRCLNPNHSGYAYYGGRGITICDEWLDKEVFKEWARSNGYREGLSLDRIDNDQGYGPLNCRWATREEQGQNKRKTVWLTHDNETLTLADWAKRLGISTKTLKGRLQVNMPDDKLFHVGKLPAWRHTAKLEQQKLIG